MTVASVAEKKFIYQCQTEGLLLVKKGECRQEILIYGYDTPKICPGHW